MKRIKIGITIKLESYSQSLWNNGMILNILILCHLLKNSKKDYDVYLLNVEDLKGKEDLKPSYLRDINTPYFDDKYMDMDIIIMMGSQVHESKIKKFKEREGKKFIAYKCGNNYVLDMEKVLFGDNEKTYVEIETLFDEVWYIPQQHETNYGYYTTLYRTDAIMVPFIWHNKFLLESVKSINQGHEKGSYKKNHKYIPFKDKKTIGIMEPNINIVKYGMIPTMIAEQSYRGEIGQNKINSVMITNSEKLKTNHKFISTLKSFDLFKDKKITAEGRYQTSFIVTQHLDVVICHQLANPLNYLYLDVAFLGYPVLHNAPLCKDIGYYYEGSDTVGASKLLDYILTEHDNNIDEYNSKNNKALFRYYADNPKLIETYDKLIDNLYNGGNKHLKYDPNTNSYFNL